MTQRVALAPVYQAPRPDDVHPVTLARLVAALSSLSDVDLSTLSAMPLVAKRLASGIICRRRGAALSALSAQESAAVTARVAVGSTAASPAATPTPPAFSVQKLQEIADHGPPTEADAARRILAANGAVDLPAMRQAMNDLIRAQGGADANPEPPATPVELETR